VSLKLAKQDELHLHKFREFLGTNAPLRVRQGRTVELVVCSKYIVEKLISYGLTPRKSLTLAYPSVIPREYQRHFVRGVFDGDGCVGTGGHHRGVLRLVWGICGGSPKFLQRLEEVVREQIGTKPRSVLKSKENFYWVRWTGKPNLVRLYQWLYDGAEVFLPRKKQRFEELLGLSQKVA
jgi:hypothetical protein